MQTVKRDLWFTRYEGRLFYVTTRPGDEPKRVPAVTSSVARTYKAMRENGVEVVSVGILPPEMLGLE